MLNRFFAERAWLSAEDGEARDVTIDVHDGFIAAVGVGLPVPDDATRLPGVVLPGLVNAHSHAFHRALRGRTHGDGGDFWSWRERMYAAAGALTPGRYLALARAAYAEMALTGITTVVEFHYVHHDADGRPYPDPAAMDAALARAAADAGVRLVLLDTCYLRGDVDGTPLSGTQRRFGDGDIDGWLRRVDHRASALDGSARLGAAIHSVRGCPPEAMRAVADWARHHAAPLHIHLSEQVKENEACLAATGLTPTALCAREGVLGPLTTAIHATHLTDDDIGLLGATGTMSCFCPTTERDLADGIGPASRLVAAGSPLCLGSDSHAVVDLFEEARAVELNERLATMRRGTHPPDALLAAATANGAASAGLGPDAGRIAAGSPADFVAVDVDTPRLAGAVDVDLAAGIVFAATGADVTHVYRDGEPVVIDRRHVRVDVAGELAASIRDLFG